jgi:uncharacterized membrane protein
MKTAAVLATLLLLTVPAHAVDVFKWTDTKGVVHYGDRPPLAKAGNAASAATLSVPGNELSDDEVRAAQQKLDEAREQITTPTYPSSTYAYRSRRPAAANGCTAAWRAYDASAACFSRHRVGDGKGVTAAGQAYCTDVPQPTCAR